MATKMLDQNFVESHGQASSAEKSLHRRRWSLARILRNTVVATPFFLFVAAILAGLGFYATAQPIFGSLSLGFALAAGVLSIVIAFFLPGS